LKRVVDLGLRAMRDVALKKAGGKDLKNGLCIPFIYR